MRMHVGFPTCLAHERHCHHARHVEAGDAGRKDRGGADEPVLLEGRVDEFGQAQIGGTLNPFEPKAFTDIAVNFRNVAMSPLTPYSATFAGRRIASGKLSLDLQYKLNNSQLQGENKVLLEQFTLGERVEDTFLVTGPSLRQDKVQLEIEKQLLEAVAA